MTETIPRYDILLQQGAPQDVPDEPCDGGPHDLCEPVYREERVERRNGRWVTVGYRYLCAECTRAQALNHYLTAPDNGLDDPPPCVERVERCSSCGFWRCRCPELGE